MGQEYILGLHIGLHDSSAALLKNGELIVMAEQERFSRNKIAEGEPPIEATLFCLRKAGITLKDVRAIALGTDWAYRDSLLDIPLNEKNNWIKVDEVRRYLPNELFGNCVPPIMVVRHHLAHASSAYRVSGYDEAAILVIDNRGENESTSLAWGKGGDISFVEQYDISKSLGIFYSRACQFTGLYGKHREVGKFMGLASYGKNNVRMPMTWENDKIIYTDIPDVSGYNNYYIPMMRTNQLMDYFKSNCFPYEKGLKEEIMAYANFAASAQCALEEIIIGLARKLKKITNSDNLVLAGGVALNCSANGRLEKENIFSHIFVQPVAGDAGTALGAAYQIDYELFGKRANKVRMKNCYYGEEYSDECIQEVLDEYSENLEYTKYSTEKMCDVVSEKLLEGKIVGWFQGRFEVGPRALGHRSILATPQKRESLVKLNNIKEREMWRPIAPSVLKQYYSEYFDGSCENKYFMNVATTVKEEMRKIIPAVVHVDNTARPQVVEDNKDIYYRLIEEFAKKTGVPILCNTSFNLKGEPLVASPDDAVKTFLKKEFDLLAIGNFVVEKRKNGK